MSLLVSKDVAVAQVKLASKVFAQWLDAKSAYFQHCIADSTLMTKRVGSMQLKLSKSMLPLKEPLLKLAGTVDGRLDKSKLNSVRQLTASSILEFLHTLEDADFATKERNEQDERDNFNVTLHRYTGLFKTLFGDETKQSIEHEFAVANNFVEFCFNSQSFPHVQEILLFDDAKPLGRLLYVGMWKTLAGSGWKYWHLDTLNRLRSLSEQGRTIVYIAGGSDIYQLLVHGVYNIRVIDPQLHGSQPNYYADEWEWLVRGKGPNINIGDELHLQVQDKKIVARRAHAIEGKRFSVVMDAGEELRPQSGTVVWDIFENDVHKGVLTFERRFAGQDDFVAKENEELLMSFNELFFIASPEEQDGWPIDPHKLPDNFKIHVKQLRRPMTKQMIENMAWVEEEHLAFLRLGSSVK